MGFRFHRSKKILPGVRLNFSKSGLGLSFGRKGLRYSIGPRGSRTTIGIPGTGLSYISYFSNKKKNQNYSVSSSNGTDIVYYDCGIVSLPVIDVVYCELIKVAKTDIERAVRAYTAAVGFVEDKAYRVCKETGEQYKPSDEQLAVERYLLEKWEALRIKKYLNTHIQPVLYCAIAVLLGWISVHRIVINHKIEGIIRAVLFLYFANSVEYLIVPYVLYFISVIEGLITLAMSERDEKGFVVPFGFTDLAILEW